MSIPMIWTLLRTFLLYILYIVYSGLWRGIVCDIPGLEFIFPESTKISWVDSRYDNNSQSRQVSWQKFTELTGYMTKIPFVDRLYDKIRFVDRLYDKNSLSRQALWQKFPESTGFMTKITRVDRLLTKIPWVDRLYDNNSHRRQALWQKFLESTGFMTTIPSVDRLYDKHSLSRQALTKIPWVDRLYSNAPNASYLLRVDILLTCRKHLRDGTISLRSMGHKPKYIYA